jgi:hypothetical protein
MMDALNPDAVASVNGKTGAVTLYLDDLADVNTPVPADGQVLTYASGLWIAAAGSSILAPGSTKQLIYNNAGVFGAAATMVFDNANNRLGVNTTGPTETLDIKGNLQIKDADTATKEYRFRTSGSSLDLEGSGAALIVSMWDSPNYAGTQRGKLVLKINENTSQLIGDWEVAATTFGSGHHWFGGTTGGEFRINDDQQDADVYIKSQGNSHMLYMDASTNRIGIGAAVPGETLDVMGNFQVKDADTSTKSYRFRTSGSNLDVDFSGKDAFISVFSAASYGGTQRNYLRLEAGAAIAHAIGVWQFTDGPFSGAKAIIDGTTGLIYPVQAVTASAPSYVKGAMYFDTTLNKLRIGGATAWETVTST